ncbi:MAG: LysM peptidoglycan-binding domain-containing protein [Bacteroidales bacterium]|nr:LysM peptidoglycan-binding domain-containing protein [Bacteroidales bacterium]
MIKRLFAIILFAFSLAGFQAAAQQYEAPEVKISQDKVRVNGKSFYAHVVTEKQTLYSISKAYNVSLQDIFDSNKNLDLENAGLKAGQVIFIPTQPSAPADNSTAPADTKPGSSTGSSAMDRWLFPGNNRMKPVTEGETVSSASQSDPFRENAPETVSPSVPNLQQPDSLKVQIDSLTTAADSLDAFVLDIPERISAALLLPFTSSKHSDNTVDFYSGLLLAARDLGKSGIQIDIDAIDVRDSSSITSSRLADYDIVFGPITSKDMKAMLGKCPEGKFIISPLDPQAAALSKQFPSIQAPTPTALQNQDIVHWAIEDMQPGDSLVLITQKGVTLSEGSKCVIDAIKESGVKYHTISYGILEGLQIQKAFEWHCSGNATTRYIVAADDESFMNDAVRNVNLMLFKKHDVALYAPSRIRSFNMIETEYLHSVNTHISAAYFTDFDNKNVSNFIMAYRALFNAEPNQFAFHGYDTMHFFVNICRTYGRQWPKVLQDYSERGMQTDFRFVREEGSEGFVNTAVRRVVYTPEYKIVLQ